MDEKEYKVERSLRMFEQVAKRIADFILSEKLPVGSKIPTERDLSIMLEVSRSSIREGLRVLELMKYLESKQGGGTFVSKPPSFLIPSYELKQNLDIDTLNQYYEIFVHCAERIVNIFIQKKESNTIYLHNRTVLSGEEDDFWKEFFIWIEELGIQIGNSPLLSLWLSTKALLVEHQYFLGLDTTIKIDQFLDLFYKRELLNLNELFIKLASLYRE